MFKKCSQSCIISWKKLKQEICGNRMKAGFFNVIIQDIAVHGTNDKKQVISWWIGIFQYLTVFMYVKTRWMSLVWQLWLAVIVPYIYIYYCSKYQLIPFKNIWVIVRKQNLNQNVNLIQGEIISTIHTTELQFLLSWSAFIVKTIGNFINVLDLA